MALRILAFLVMALGLGIPAVQRPGPVPLKRLAELKRAKLEAARNAFDAAWTHNDWPHVEIPYRWSCRLLEAGREMSEKKHDQIDPCQAHLDRMKDLERITRERYQSKLVTIDQLTATAYYVAEAQIWLEQAKE